MISWGASTETLNKKGESPLSLEPKRNSFSKSDSYCLETNVDNAVSNDKNSLGFIPNYLQYPEFNHKVSIKQWSSRGRGISMLARFQSGF